MYPNELDSDTLIGVSDTSYSNDERAMDWLYHFDRHSKLRQQGVWRMLIFDGYGSYCTKEFLEYCENNRIKP